MRSLPLLRLLRSTVAVGAVAFGSAAANAACTTANGVVTCTNSSSATEVNAAIERTPSPSFTLVIAPGATVTRALPPTIGNTSNPRFSGNVGYINNGAVGTPLGTVEFLYNGSIANPANTFMLDNRGVQNGGISATNVGGAIVGANSGTVTGGINLRGAGPITFSSTGRVFGDTFFLSNAISLVSSRLTTATGMDGVQRTTETGGPIAATISGPVAAPASPPPPGLAPSAQNVSVSSVGGVDVTLNGPAGSVAAQSRGIDRDTQTITTTVGATSTTTTIDNQRTVGADARGTVGTGGQIGNLSVVSGPGSATAIVNGSLGNVVVGSGLTLGNVNATATGTIDTSRSTSSRTGTAPASSSTFSRSTTTNGGAATVDVGAAGRVTGG